MCCECGEKVRFIPYETCCWCCSNRAGWCDNYCSLCGLKDGEPKVMCGFLECLEDGESLRLQEAFNSARSQWCTRTGLP